MTYNYTITIITNIFNEEKNLPGFLNSLLRQTHPEFKVLIVDDGSTDNSWDVIEQYKEKLDIGVLSLSHVGMNRARAKGFENVHTDIGIIFDADEIIDPYCVERLVEEFDDPRVGAVGGRVIYASPNGSWINKGEYVLGEARFQLRYNVDGIGDLVQGGCMALRVAAVEGVGGLSKNPFTRDDGSISWRLTSSGWLIRGRKDAVVYHPPEIFDITPAKLLRRGYYKGLSHMTLIRTHPNKIFFWKVWARFIPIVTLLVAIIAFPHGLVLLLLNLLGALFLMRRVKHSIQYKIYGWLYFMGHDTGWGIGFLVGLVRACFGRKTAN